MNAAERGPHAGYAALHVSSLRRPTLRLLVATAILLLSIYLVVEDLSGANRPHELHNAPWVAGISVLNLIPCAGVLTTLVRYARGCRGRPRNGFFGLVLGLVVVGVLNALILVGAVGVLPDVLGQ